MTNGCFIVPVVFFSLGFLWVSRLFRCNHHRARNTNRGYLLKEKDTLCCPSQESYPCIFHWSFLAPTVLLVLPPATCTAMQQTTILMTQMRRKTFVHKIVGHIQLIVPLVTMEQSGIWNLGNWTLVGSEKSAWLCGDCALVSGFGNIGALHVVSKMSDTICLCRPFVWWQMNYGRKDGCWVTLSKCNCVCIHINQFENKQNCSLWILHYSCSNYTDLKV